uniref:uncharacterized protein LOC105351605 n=1 Tax=Fragaria vesca subsp. vesca TaxID=101020 RepID=UPI0005CACDA3|nr:PREDICTED: uncharacterized protein LOC105351605 [Fragaria vesca subsp. vesca]
MKPVIASDGVPAIMSAGQKNAADIARRIKAVQQMKRDAASGATTTASEMMNATISQVELNVIPSEETVSAPRKVRYSRKAKSQSTSVSRNAKSKKKKEQPDKKESPNITGGLRLLTRQMVTMARVTKRLIRGIQLPIECDDHGTPVGPNAKDMQSYIGVLARTTVPIIFDDWRNVDDEYKDKIWESIEEAYVIPKQCRKHVLKSASSKWRGFKSFLTTHYIVPFMETPEKLENPPDDYRCIPKLHWSLFVEDRVSGEFKVCEHVNFV